MAPIEGDSSSPIEIDRPMRFATSPTFVSLGAMERAANRRERRLAPHRLSGERTASRAGGNRLALAWFTASRTSPGCRSSSEDGERRSGSDPSTPGRRSSSGRRATPRRRRRHLARATTAAERSSLDGSHREPPRPSPSRAPARTERAAFPNRGVPGVDRRLTESSRQVHPN
jgi:hypothetical protein